MSRERLGRDRACPPFRTHAVGDRARPPTGAPLLRLWRVVAPQALGPETARSLRQALAGIEPPVGRRRWDAVLRGDPAAMARVAIVVLRVGGPIGSCADAVASALLMRALAGDRTAPVILASALRKLARLRADDVHLPALAARWATWVPCVPPPRHAGPNARIEADA